MGFSWFVDSFEKFDLMKDIVSTLDFNRKTFDIIENDFQTIANAITNDKDVSERDSI